MQDNNEKSGFFARTSRAQNDSPLLRHPEFISGSQKKLTKRFRLGGRNDGYSSRHPVHPLWHPVLDTGFQHTNEKEPLTRISSIRKAQAEILPSPTRGDGKRAAFTLAEVLITLGIIGVVAAMTLPVLTGKIDDIILRNQMKNSYSTFYQAFNKTIMDMESVDCYYPEGAGGTGAVTSQCNDFYNNLVKNLKVIKHCPNNALAGGCIKTFKKYNTEAGCAGYSQYSIETKVPVWTFVDGSSFIPYNISGKNGALFLFDVNGLKGPNVGGKDIFPLIIYYHPKRGYSLGLGGCNGIVPYEYRSNLKNFLLK